MRTESIELLKHLNEVNDVKIYSVEDEEFASYGRIVKGYDFSDIRIRIRYGQYGNFCLHICQQPAWKIRDCESMV